MPETILPKPQERSIFITHHTPDMDHISTEQFAGIAKELKSIGFSEHRFDVRWKTFAPKKDMQNHAYLERSARLARVARDQGLEPLVILSTPPGWSYRGKSPEQIQDAFATYARTVKHHFDREQVPVKSVQILNELNNPVFTPTKLIKEMPGFADAVKRIFGADTDVTATMVIAKPWANVEPFMKKHKGILSHLSSIGLDFYPGTYQLNKQMLKPKSAVTVSRQALEAIASGGTKNIRKDFLALLENQLTDVHEFSNALDKVKELFPGKPIDLGEFGFPTLDPLQRRNPKHEALQRLAVERIAHAILPVLEKHKIRKIGFYELFDDKEFGVLNWGILNDRGEPKKVLPKLPEILSFLQGKPTKTALS